MCAQPPKVKHTTIAYHMYKKHYQTEMTEEEWMDDMRYNYKDMASFLGLKMSDNDIDEAIITGWTNPIY